MQHDEVFDDLVDLENAMVETVCQISMRDTTMEGNRRAVNLSEVALGTNTKIHSTTPSHDTHMDRVTE